MTPYSGDSSSENSSSSDDSSSSEGEDTSLESCDDQWVAGQLKVHVTTVQLLYIERVNMHASMFAKIVCGVQF